MRQVYSVYNKLPNQCHRCRRRSGCTTLCFLPHHWVFRGYPLGVSTRNGQPNLRLWWLPTRLSLESLCPFNSAKWLSSPTKSQQCGFSSVIWMGWGDFPEKYGRLSHSANWSSTVAAQFDHCYGQRSLFSADYWYTPTSSGAKWITWWAYSLGFGGANPKDRHTSPACSPDSHYWKGAAKGCMNRATCIIKEMIVWCPSQFALCGQHF